VVNKVSEKSARGANTGQNEMCITEISITHRGKRGLNAKLIQKIEWAHAREGTINGKRGGGSVKKPSQSCFGDRTAKDNKNGQSDQGEIEERGV